MWHTQSDTDLLKAIGASIRAERIRFQLRQEDLAAKANVGVATVQRLEAGDPIRTDTLISVMRIVQMLDRLEPAFNPSEPPSPFDVSDEDDDAGHTRSRVRRSTGGQPGMK